ncbi:MAG: hypothetical protein JOZ55_10585 [Alphaproteobacteria bacterium]|nr:hypothetical protein [Alphaproteobacteria bacterium]
MILAVPLALPATAVHAADPAPRSLPLQLNTGSVESAGSWLGGDRFSLGSGTVAARGLLNTSPSLLEPNGPPAPRVQSLRDLAASISLAPALALDIGYRLDALGSPGEDVALDGLFLSPAKLSASPAGDDTTYLGATYTLPGNVALHLGDAMSAANRNAANENPFAGFGRPVDALLNLGARTANTLMAGVSFTAGNSAVDFTASRSLEKVAFGNEQQEFNGDTVNVSADVKFGGGWVTTASYGESLSKLDIKPSALSLSSPSALRQSGYAVSIAKHGVFGDDALGLSVSRPTDPEAVSGTFASVVPAPNEPVFIGPDHLLSDQKAETDIELGYTTSFSDSIALQTNAAYDFNFQGRNGANAVELLSRAKIKF